MAALLHWRSVSALTLAVTLASMGTLRITVSSHQAARSDGEIRGVALARDSQPLGGHRIRLRLPDPVSPGAPFSPAGSDRRLNTVTNLQGEFAFTDLGPGRYVVEISANNNVAEVPVTLSEEAMVVDTVSITEPRLGSGISVVQKLAVIGIVTGAILVGLFGGSDQPR